MMSEELRFFGGSGQTAKETIETIGEIKRKNSPATLTIDAAGCRKPIPKQPPKCLNNPDGMPPFRVVAHLAELQHSVVAGVVTNNLIGMGDVKHGDTISPLAW